MRHAALARENAEDDQSAHTHRGNRHAPAERRAESEADDRRERIAEIAADTVRRIGMAQPPHRDVRALRIAKSDGWNTPLPAPMIAAHGKIHHGFGASDASSVPTTSNAMPPSSTGRAPSRSTTKPAANLHDAARDVERAGDEPEQRPRDVELGAQ